MSINSQKIAPYSMNIKKKLILSFLGFILISIMVESLFSFYASEKALTKQVLNQLESVASIQRHRIESIVAQNLERLRLVSSRTQLRITLAKHSQNPKQQYLEKITRILNDARSSIKSFDSISIVSNGRKIIASTDSDIIGTDADSEIANRGKQGNVVDQFFIGHDNNLMLYLAGPLQLDGVNLGVLLIKSRVNNIIESVHDYSGLGRSGETLLGKKDENGDALFLTPLRFDKTAALKRILAKENSDAPIHRAMESEPQLITHGIDYRGVEVLASTQYIAELGWAIVVKMDKSEAYAPVMKLRQSLLLILLAGGILAVIVAVYIANSISKPIVGLTRVAREISHGNLKIRANTNSAGEIGILASAFNHMTEKLTTSEKKYRQLVELMQEGIWVTDQDMKTVYVNPALCGMLGYSDSELMGAEITQYMKKSSQRKFNKRDSKMETFQYNDYELVKKDGSIITATIQRANVTDDEGKTISTIAGVMDVTERIKAKNKLQLHRDKLEELVAKRTQDLELAYKELESFSYSVSHDLRAPLRAIDGFSLALQQDYAKLFDGTAKDYLHRVRNASQLMGHLIDDMLILSKVTRYDLTNGEVNLVKLANYSLSSLQEEYPDRKVKFECSGDITVQGDEHLLQIMLDNLIGNAWKYTSKSKRARIKLQCLDKGGKTIYCISDNGCGFDMKYKDKLFKAFQRLHSNKEFPGTGIGLATVYRIINRHRGNVWAESELNQGSQFYFTLNEIEESAPQKIA